MRIIPKPKPDEYPAYSQVYMDHVQEDDGRILERMRQSLADLRELIDDLPEEKLLFRYAEGKWTIKEILLHLVDDERIFVYRALRFARNDATPLPGFEENHYARYSGANDRSLASLFAEFATVREATLSLYEHLPEDALMRRGSADGPANERTVRAMLYHVAGHELHHVQVIRERYLS